MELWLLWARKNQVLANLVNPKVVGASVAVADLWSSIAVKGHLQISDLKQHLDVVQGEIPPALVPQAVLPEKTV